MKESEHSILKIYASTTDRVGQKLLYEHIVLLAKDRGISGVTGLQGELWVMDEQQISAPSFWELD
jgi:PII-like signaling protein